MEEVKEQLRSARTRDFNAGRLFRLEIENGDLKKELFLDILDHFDASRIIFEAPTHSAQMYFINTLGHDVNLGNVSPNDLLILECERVGLRCETFFQHERRT